MSSPKRKAWQVAMQIFVAASALSLVACDSDSALTVASSSPDNDETPQNQPDFGAEPTLTGTLISQQKTGANLCIDINHNRRCDPLEPNATSSDDGSFSLALAKMPAPLIAEMRANDNVSALQLFAIPNSQTISALTTVLYWSMQQNPSLSAEQASTQLQQLLALEDLDSRSPETAEAESDAVTTNEDLAEQTTDALITVIPDYQSKVRQSIEQIIANTQTTAYNDALVAGLDPGTQQNQKLLSRLVADQVLQRLPQLADALKLDPQAAPDALVVSLPFMDWPAGDIVQAMQFHAGEAPVEADPISLLKSGLHEIVKDCETNNECRLRVQSRELFDDNNLRISNFSYWPDGSVETLPAQTNELLNWVLKPEGIWQSREVDNSITVRRTGELSAELLDANGTRHTVWATARELSDLPTAPLLDSLGLAQDDFADAFEHFGEASKIVDLQRKQLNDQFEMRFEPSASTQERALAEQLLSQAAGTLKRIEASSLDSASHLDELEFKHAQSTQMAESAKATLDALERAQSEIDESLNDALAVLAEAQTKFDAMEQRIERVAALQSVLSDIEIKMSALEIQHRDAQTLVNTAQTDVLAATAALETARANLSGTELVNVEPEGAVADPLEDVEDAALEQDTEATELQALQLQAERDLIITEAALADATEAALEAFEELEQAIAEHGIADASLKDAVASQSSDNEVETILQSAQLLVDANQANLSLINEQIEQAMDDLQEALNQVDIDSSELLAAQITSDTIAAALSTATNELASAQAALDDGSSTSTSGCEDQLPEQSVNNLNCLAIERQIGNSPATKVQTLAELTDTRSTLTVLQLHPDYAVTLIPSNSSTGGRAIWHTIGEAYNQDEPSQPESQWSKSEINETTLMIFNVPSELLEPGDSSSLIMLEHDSYVRPGVVVSAGKISRQSLLNRAAFDSLIPRN